jgi:phosphoribosylaminoimidazole-succinocarboxamide synthase
LRYINIPELGDPVRGKVRDNWVVENKGSKIRIMVTTDRQSAFIRNICTIPGKGEISNLISEFWFEKTKDIIPNHKIAVPHPNVLIAKQAAKVIPIEVVVRRYMATGVTPTSIYFNYIEKGRREIYGIKFPDGLLPNQEFPMGNILTPTTKALNGHDEELTHDQTLHIVDREFGPGLWEKIDQIAHALFERARVHCLSKGVLLVDTKFEFGIDGNGNLMLIDEVLTPDGSRFWLKDTYEKSIIKNCFIGIDCCRSNFYIFFIKICYFLNLFMNFYYLFFALVVIIIIT